MRVTVGAVFDSDESVYGSHSVECPQAETCTVDLMFYDVAGAVLDARTATSVEARIHTTQGELMLRTTAAVYEPAQQINRRVLALDLSRLPPGPYTWAVQATIGARTCQVVRTSSLTVLP